MESNWVGRESTRLTDVALLVMIVVLILKLLLRLSHRNVVKGLRKLGLLLLGDALGTFGTLLE